MIFSKLSESEKANIAEVRLGFGNAAGEEPCQSLSRGNSRETSREREGRQRVRFR